MSPPKPWQSGQPSHFPQLHIPSEAAEQPCVGHHQPAGEHASVHQQSLQPPQLTARAASAAPKHGPSGPHPSTDHQQPSWQHPNRSVQVPAGVQSLYGVPLQSQTAEQILVQEIEARQPRVSTLGHLSRPSAHAQYNQLPAHMAWQSLSLPSSNAFQDLQGVHRFLGLGRLQ